MKQDGRHFRIRWPESVSALCTHTSNGFKLPLEWYVRTVRGIEGSFPATVLYSTVVIRTNRRERATIAYLHPLVRKMSFNYVDYFFKTWVVESTFNKATMSLL